MRLRERAVSARSRLQRVVRSRVAKVAAGLALAALVAPGLLYMFPSLAGADASFVVLSGSMEPFLSPGDIIFVRQSPAEEIAVGTIITYRSTSDPSVTFTHRVIEVVADEAGGTRYRTQGDANPEPDAGSVRAEDVVGTYAFHVPMWGHLLVLLRSKLGYVGFILVPGALIVLRELVRVYRELDRIARERRPTEER